eukprot:GCRY01000525.1.p1 GENE.GCRY01000525.1~~GCRY01000525.1.p1  ORF type:complete len:334 (+),score=86.66 GCRY01000525.1:78-1079(+)
MVKFEKEPLRVAVTGAGGAICYNLIFSIANGDMLGRDQPVIFQLLEIPAAMVVLEAVKMELQDGAFPLVKDVILTSDAEVAFKDVDIACLVGAMPRGPGMERKDLLEANAKIFKIQGAAMNKVAKKTVKIVVVGNPANTNALILSKCAPDLPRTCFSALTRLDENRLRSHVALKTGTPISDVYQTIIWGNHSSTQYPCIEHGYVVKEGEKTSLSSLIDSEYHVNEMIPSIQKRGAAIIKARGKSSAASAAKAIVDHMHDWHCGSDRVVSMGVYADGSYGIEEGLMYSFPCTVENGAYKIVTDLPISEFSRKMMNKTEQELKEERDVACKFLGI